MEDGTLAKIISLINGKPQGVLGVSACSDKEQWRYLIAVSSSADIDDSLVEVYFDPNPSDTQYEVWVPVRKAGEAFEKWKT